MGNYLSPLNTKLDANQVIKRIYDEDQNRIRVDAEVSATIGTVTVVIDAASGDNIKISDGTHDLDITSDNAAKVRIAHTTDSVKLGNGVDFITTTQISAKTALDVNVTNYQTSGQIQNTYNEINSVANNILTTLLTKTVTASGLLKKITVSGTNIAEYTVELNAVILSKKRTFYGNSLNETFLFDEGIVLSPSDVIEIKVIHYKPSVADFNANILILEN